MKSREEWHEDYEHKWGFPLPAEYIRLAVQGCFDHPNPTGMYSQLINSPYLWVPEMEWRSFRDLLNPNTTASDIARGFASFAFSGGGDDWCWYPAAAVCGRVPVMQCPRDEFDATFYAPDFVTAVYRNILEVAVGGFGCNESMPAQRQYLLRWAKELGPLLSPAAAQTLNLLATAPAKRFKVGRVEHIGLVSPDELNVFIKRDIAFDLLGGTIKWISVK